MFYLPHNREDGDRNKALNNYKFRQKKKESMINYKCLAYSC